MINGFWRYIFISRPCKPSSRQCIPVHVESFILPFVQDNLIGPWERTVSYRGKQGKQTRDMSPTVDEHLVETL